jgi:hypothetical protein
MTEDSKNILSIESKEKFRRTILLLSRLLAFFLILGIFFIGFVQIKYSKEVTELKNKYGSNAYCYLCGYESGKVCGCHYIPELVVKNSDFDAKTYFTNIAISNAAICENINNQEKELNFSLD